MNQYVIGDNGLSVRILRLRMNVTDERFGTGAFHNIVMLLYSSGGNFALSSSAFRYAS